MYSTEFLSEAQAIDTTPRTIKSNDIVDFVCKCGTHGQRKWSGAKKSKKLYGFYYQCNQCLKDKYANRGEEWLTAVRRAAQSDAHKSRAASNSRKHVLKYTPEIVEAAIVNEGLIYEGSLDSPSNVIKIIWPDGVFRTIRIRRMMKEGIKRPKTGTESMHHQKHLNQINELGLTVILYDNLRRAKITYKGVTWEQYWANHVDKKCLKNIKNIDNGLRLQELLDAGATLSQACKTVGVPPSRYYKNLRKGVGVIQTAVATRSLHRLIDLPGAIYNKKMDSTKYRPDILVADKSLIIETDGMRFHSEEFVSKGYHSTKWNVFNKLGYKFLAFSEYEIKEKRVIVDSMIAHRMGKTANICYASKCKVRQLNALEADTFLERCHMRGKGQGEAKGLYFEDKLVCVLRYRMEKNTIHISRFACELNTAVTGGYSKLLARLPKDVDIINFVDRRHGTGEHLLKLGFTLSGVHTGFEWTDGYFHWNRRSYPGNTGYDHGLCKFWDYGQAKYVRKATPPSAGKAHP